METIKKITFTMLLAVFVIAAPLLSYADAPQALPPEQQTTVAPAEQSTDQQSTPAAPAPQEEGAGVETSK